MTRQYWNCFKALCGRAKYFYCFLATQQSIHHVISVTIGSGNDLLIYGMKPQIITWTDAKISKIQNTSQRFGGFNILITQL